MKPLSIKDIASKANVSITTVSFILNGKAEKMRISQKMIAKVNSIIQEVGFRPNQVARSLRTGNSKTLGLIVEDISNPFFASIARLIEDRAYKHGYKIIYSSTENDIDKAKGLFNMFKSRQVDGYIIAPMAGMEDDIKALIAEKIPVVLFDRNLNTLNTNCVMIDNLGGTYMATEYLIRKLKKKIAFVTVDIDVEQMKDRLKGYEQALLDYQMEPLEKLRIEIPFTNSAKQTTNSLKKFFKKNKEIDAVIFSTNYLAVRGLFCFREMGKTIDDHFQMIAYDDHDVFSLHSPPISVVNQPVEDIADHIISLMLKELALVNSFEKKPDPQKIILSAEFIER